MKTFKITINLENAAFEENACTEIARILSTVAAQLQDWDLSEFKGDAIRIKDYNGNTCGSIVIEDN